MAVKVFHSMALAGRTPSQIRDDRFRHHQWIKEYFNDVEILDTYISEMPSDEIKNNPLWYFGKGIMEFLSIADYLVVPHNWSKVRGVRCEKYIAEQYGVPVIVMPDFEGLT